MDIDNERTYVHKFTSDQKLKWWGNGEWVEEADTVEWKYKGVHCEIERLAHLKAL